MTEREAHIGFSKFVGVGPLKFKHLVNFFGSAVRAWESGANELLKVGFGQILTQKFQDFRGKFNPQVYENELLAKEIKIVTRVDREFPQKLLEIADPPIVLYVRGKLPNQDLPHMGVVGTRKPTNYGRDISAKLAGDLALAGCVIVSGLARGVDSIAHRATLDSGAFTVAVLGCGVDIIYPPEHKDLYYEIIEKNGAVISEVPPGQTVLRGLF
ncbi:MAG: DNA-processing protein DprA, partial [Patescibacteria group bacterium]